MARAADCGAILLPPMPAFYHRPQSIMDIVHQSIGKALDQVGIEHDLFERWSGHGGHRRGALRAETGDNAARDAAAAPAALSNAAAVPARATPSAVPAEPAVPATGR
ncbi:MAG: hypothetical protein U1F67_03700 [Rubrivivax sp.]